MAEATATSLDRAGRTVVFSALTVAIALSGLMVFEIPFIRAIGVAGVSVVLVALAVALTLLPALCALGARRLLRRGTEVAGDTGVFSRLAEVVQRMPWVVVTVVDGLLVVLAVPVLRMELTSSGPELLPRRTPRAHLLRGLPRGLPAARRRGGARRDHGPGRPGRGVGRARPPTGPGVQSVDPVNHLDTA